MKSKGKKVHEEKDNLEWSEQWYSRHRTRKNCHS